jgi:hypothetical protein
LSVVGFFITRSTTNFFPLNHLPIHSALKAERVLQLSKSRSFALFILRGADPTLVDIEEDGLFCFFFVVLAVGA